MPVASTVTAALASAVLLGGLWFAQDQQGPAPRPAPEPFTPVAPVPSLMSGLASALGSAHEALEKTEDEDRFDAVRRWADVVAELSNVHMRHDRKPDYLRMAKETRDFALELSRGARADAPDQATIKALYTQLETSCMTCHDA